MSTSPELQRILEDLAAGRIDASAAARLIEDAKAKPAEPDTADLPPEADPAPGTYQQPAFGDEVPPSRRRAAGTRGVDRISVRAIGRRVRIVGDPAVATASAEGPHVLRRNGSVLEVTSDGDIGPSLDGFTLLRPPRSLDDIRALGLGKELLLHVNPSIIVDVELTAGSLATEKVPYLGKVRVTAGGAVLTDVSEVNDVLVQAGSTVVKGVIATGRNRIRCESGSLTVHLGAGSQVTIHAEAQLGKVAWSGAHSGAADEVVLGDGSARLDLAVVMGYASVKAGESE
ncbi:hypothetical protein [Propionicicella superfundia]|uniref:hypothetical protein n=1 Tax=Propionicicella superfundia TaxID=348582 RepID=UPI00041A2C7B|nr:hypothetical protein [Propionicicella superfundia]